MEIYILQGECGAWEDRVEWTLGGFYLMEEAVAKQNALHRCMDGMLVYGYWSTILGGHPPDDFDEIMVDNHYKCALYELRKLDDSGMYSEHEMPTYFIDTLEVT